MWRRRLAPVAKALAFVALCLLCGELVLRVAGALWPRASLFVAHHRVHDAQLGWRLNADYPDIDAWGFRNQAVPARADIVILGDSQTYGYGVAPELSWPRQLAATTGLTTYNIACSGYSAVHGLAIWQDAISLQPQTVIAAVYAGNDLYDTFELVYGHDQLPQLRSTDVGQQARIAAAEQASPLSERARLVTRMGRATWPLRDVLRDSSALFHFIRHLQSGSAALAGRAPNSWQATSDRARRHPQFLYAHDGGLGARTTLTVTKRLLPLDTTDPRIEEGLYLTLDALADMAQRSKAAGMGFLILWIPTKELVFAPQLAADVPDLARLVQAETFVQSRVRDLATELGVSFIDALPVLRRSLERGEQPYPETADGHPTAAGYGRIARVVASCLQGEPSCLQGRTDRL